MIKRTGTITRNAKGKILSGGAFAVDTKAEGAPLELAPIDPKKAFIQVGETAHEGNESDWSTSTRYKPSPECARRLRTMFGLPPGNAAGFLITESSYEMGDGWAADEAGHDVEVEFKGKTLLTLDGDNPMDRLRKRIEFSHRDVLAEARHIVTLPEHERWVCISSDRFSTKAGLVRIDSVDEDTVTVYDHYSKQQEWFPSGESENLLLDIDRSAALKKRPNLAFTATSPAHDKTDELAKLVHDEWLGRSEGPIMVTVFDPYAEHPDGDFHKVDARTVPRDKTYKIEGYSNLTLNEVASWCGKRATPLDLENDIDAAATELIAAIEARITGNEKYFRSNEKYPPLWRPVTDRDIIKAMLTAVWAKYQ